MNPAWPATIVLIALIVFTAFMAQATLLMALTMALLVLVVGGLPLTLMYATTTRITQVRRLIHRRRN